MTSNLEKRLEVTGSPAQPHAVLATMRFVAKVSTKADPGAVGWAVRDPITRLRVFGGERAFDLRGVDHWTLGASPDCSIRLDDPSGRVSRRHAALERSGDDWIISDLGSMNGLRQDGEDRKTFYLAPGMMIDVGGVKLIAESERSMQLRELLCRFIGWSPARAIDVDRAMRAVRDVANMRACLILRGAGDLSGVARRIHASALGDARPSAVHTRDEPGLAALSRAVDGSLFLDAEHLPDDIHQVVVSLRLPDVRVRLIVGANTREAAAEIAALIPNVTTISLPPLGERSDEIERVLHAYGADAAAQLGTAELGLRPHDSKWIRESGIATLGEAEDVMRRMVAMRNWGVTGGAERLGITHGALSRWARRRKIPT